MDSAQLVKIFRENASLTLDAVWKAHEEQKFKNKHIGQLHC